jgi:hypothetical protein
LLQVRTLSSITFRNQKAKPSRLEAAALAKSRALVTIEEFFGRPGPER